MFYIKVSKFASRILENYMHLLAKKENLEIYTYLNNRILIMVQLYSCCLHNNIQGFF